MAENKNDANLGKDLVITYNRIDDAVITKEEYNYIKKNVEKEMTDLLKY